MSGPEEKEFGQRVAFLRKKLGYSQTEFARKIDRSETWLSQVERGVRKIDRMSVLERLADALDVPLTELAPERRVVAAGAPDDSRASNLVMSLVSNDVLRALLDPPRPVDIDGLEVRVERAWEYAHAARYEELAELLVDLLADVEVAERHVPEGERARVRRGKARVYLAAAGALSKLGETGPAWVAIDRAMVAAAQIGDPLMIAEAAFRLAITFQAARRFDLATRAASTAASAISTVTDTDDATPAAVALLGALHLQLAVAAARSSDADTAYAHLGAAAAAAERIGEGRNDYHTEFGPANVVLHEVAVAVELGDAGRALRVADRADPARLSPERRARLLIDVAGAHAQLRHPAAVVAALTECLAIAPEQYASHSRVRELVADLLRSDHANRAEVRALADKIRIGS